MKRLLTLFAAAALALAMVQAGSQAVNANSVNMVADGGQPVPPWPPPESRA